VSPPFFFGDESELTGRKWNKDGDPPKALLRQPAAASSKAAVSRKIASRTTLPLAASQPRSRDVEDGHVPHSICR
jgi:hypothetical protein